MHKWLESDSLGQMEAYMKYLFKSLKQPCVETAGGSF